MSTSVKRTLDAFRTGQVTVSVKKSALIVNILRLKRLEQKEKVMVTTHSAKFRNKVKHHFE